MKLDPRIKSLSDVFNSVADVERAKQFIGHEGYFANEIEDFADLGRCVYGKLDACDDVYFGQYPYYWSGDGRTESFMLFIPADSLKPIKGKKYRPYTPEEFCAVFNVGHKIHFRKKGDEESEQSLIAQGIWFSPRDGKTVVYARMESHLYSFDELFNDFEWRGLYQKDFVPFGVEE